MNAPDADRETALHAATRSGSVPVVHWLLRSGADPNAATLYGTMPLLLAAMHGDVAISQLLLDAVVDPNRPGAIDTMPLQAVVHNDNSRLDLLLVRHGARMTTTDDLGQGALAIAKRRGWNGLDDGSWQDDPLVVTDRAEPGGVKAALHAGHAQ